MIVKIIYKPSKTFAGITYNTNKADRGKAGLLLTANFGALDALSDIRPQDYINYLHMVSSVNKVVKTPQFHVVFSSKGSMYSKEELQDTAVKWLREMGYGEQPYMLSFHRDTANNHVHAVTTRIGRDGKKINSAFEKVRSMKSLDKVLGYDYALSYRFSTKAQFYLLLEQGGHLGKDYNEAKLQRRLEGYKPDKNRIEEIRNIFQASKGNADLIGSLRQRHQLEIVHHSAEGKKPYGYTVIDHDTRQVFKGSEIMPLKELQPELMAADGIANEGFSVPAIPEAESFPEYSADTTDYIRPVSIADDIDDEAILGRNRRRKRKARTNTR